MPVSTPNREANPVSLEAYVPPCVLRQEAGLFIPYYNNAANDTLVAGEPIVAFGQVCIVQKTILPGRMGTLITDWIVEALLATEQATDIDQGDLVYWDTDKNAVTPIEGGAAVAGIGAAINVLPTNGFILGRAVSQFYREDHPSLDGSGNAICANGDSLRVLVASIPGAPTTYAV